MHLHKRGGAPVRIRARWTETQPDQRLLEYAELLRDGAIPSQLPYELSRLADLYKDWPEHIVQRALQQDCLRVIRDKQPRSGRHLMPRIEAILKSVTDAASLRSFAQELLVARRFAAALRQAGQRLAPEVEARE